MTNPPFILTLIIKAIDAIDGGTLVIPSQQEEVLGVFDLVRQQQTDGFQRLFAAVHVVAQEQVVALRWVSSILKEPEQIIVLPVDITCGDESVSVDVLIISSACKVISG